ncbi:MAG: sugar transferase [Pseudomonadota bacterium]
MKRVLDIVVSGAGLLVTSPVLLLAAFAVWLQDRHSPLYIADRVGKGEVNFRMVKMRSMVKNAAKTGVTSTSDADLRITQVGRLIRKLKLDEVTQLINVLIGDMSLVGPRPNVMKWGVELYTEEEKRLLSVRPGITDFASVVFADEGHILSRESDPDLAYNQKIRPWKSRLSLFHIDHGSLWLDIKVVLYTVVSIVSRATALRLVAGELRRLGAPEQLVEVASRRDLLTAYPPPGSTEIATLER